MRLSNSEYQKRYREKYPDRIKQSGKKWREKNPLARIIWEIENPKRKRFNSLRSAAVKRGINFSLQFEQIYWPTHCPILGIELDYSLHTGRKSNSPSFDRIDPTKGYESGNVRVVSYRGNVIKNDGTLEEHKKVIEYLERCQKQSSLAILLKVS